MATPTYYAKFGEFVHWYSAVERIIHYLFRHYSGLPDNVARAIDGGMSVSGLLSIINRMIVALKIPNNEQQQIKTIFDHINHITKLRDSLIHRGSESIGDVVYSTNIHLAKSPVDIEILELNISDIHNATIDCAKIYSKIDRIIRPSPGLGKADAEILKWLDQPWQYKPRPPRKPNQVHRTSGRLPLHQRVPSQK